MLPPAMPSPMPQLILASGSITTCYPSSHAISVTPTHPSVWSASSRHPGNPAAYTYVSRTLIFVVMCYEDVADYDEASTTTDP
ncbi:Uncharacterized protein OBRU01_16875 [Operophtera brumata]|uniref:Uncharacterized protein n=1 Tax=Operophtera brumata TaxID=104452 RepID=A0A0L7L0S6_OPEBR|nr:Uncharacterized protein OBRU01_16875 [Operophtera brumata]